MDKRTAFYAMHIKNNGKMVPFAGYLMPIQFFNVYEEVLHTRRHVGVFDVSHMGEVIVKGKRRKEFVNYITTNNVLSLHPEQIQYTMMLYENAGIVDDLLVYNFDESLMLVVNAANIQKDYEWIMKNKWDDVEIMNISDEISQLAVQGPYAQKTLEKIIDLNFEEFSYYYLKDVKIENTDATLSRTGYTGEDGFELYFNNKDAELIWNKVFSAGEEFNIKPIGLAARDILRLEMRYMLYGNDIDKTTNPIEAGLSWAVKTDKGDFIGKDALLKAKENLKRKLAAFEMLEKAIPRHGYKVIDENGEIGIVTSGNYSPSIDKYIGLAYIDSSKSKIGEKILIDIRGNKQALIIKPPFYKREKNN